MTKAYVIGHPIGHSLSPQIFNMFAAETGQLIDYQKQDIAPEDLLGEIAKLKQQSPIGWNVTIPHKEAMVSLMDQVDPAAQAVGAVNVVRHENGQLSGYNSDVIGFTEALAETGMDMAGKTAVLLGAGGAARATAYALGQMGAAEVVITNRNLNRAEQVATYMNGLFADTVYVAQSISNIDDDVDLYVNTTPLGMFTSPGCPKLPAHLNPKALAFDLVYKPTMSEFLQRCAARGLQTTNGLSMLAWQAVATYEIWFGPMANRQQIKEKLVQMLGKA